MLGLPKPISRTDSFHKDMQMKYESLRDKLIERGIDTIVFTGDIFTVKAPSKYDLNAISSFDELFLETWGMFNKYTIRGNHDMYKTKEGTPKNSIFELGLKHGWYETLEGTPLITDDLVVFGLDYKADVNELADEIRVLSDRAIEYSFLGKKTAIVLHEHLVPNTKDMYLSSYILYDFFTELNFDIVVGGHLHKGYPTQVIDDVTFINPWSFTRLVRDHYSVDDKHKPCFSYVEIDNQQIIETKTIAVKYRAYSSAFTETMVSETNIMGDISAFRNQIEQAGSIANIDIELLRKVSDTIDIEDLDILEEAINYIEQLLKGDEDE